MKFSIPQADFLKGLTLSNKSLLSKANLPILSNVLVIAEKNKIEIITTNLETASRIRIDSKVEKEGQTTLLGHAVSEFVQQLTGEDLLVFEKLGEEAVIECGSFNARFATMDAADFPVIPKVTSGFEIKVKGRDLAEAISKVVFCASQDESRPILTGILCEFSKNKLKMVATDGYRLGFCETKVTKEENSGTAFIIPAKSLVEISKIISEVNEDQKDSEMTILVADNLTQAVFKVGLVEFTTRLIEGEFPNWQKIIPSSFVTRAKIEKNEFLRAIKTTSIFARESGNIIRLSLESGKKGATLETSAVTAQMGSAKSKVNISLEGKGGEIAFNFRYLLDVLGVINNDDISFEMNESLNPGRITSTEGDSSSFHIIMPVRLQN